MDSCSTLINLNATCDAVKKVGGVTARVWIGGRGVWFNNFLAQQTVYFQPDNTGIDWFMSYDINSIGGNQQLFYFEGVQLKNSASFEVVPAENVNAYTHRVDLVLFDDEADFITITKQKIQGLLEGEDLFAVVLTEGGQFKVYGFEHKVWQPFPLSSFENYVTDKKGMKAVSGTGVDTVELQGQQGVIIQLEATNMLSAPFVLKGVTDIDSSTTSTNTEDIIQALNLLCL
jgi:hypothetical protein